MTADVYASDDDLNVTRTDVASTALTVIKIRADPDPDVLLRVACHLNFFNRAPLRLALERAPDSGVQIEVTLEGCSEFMSDLMCRKLMQLTCAIEVTCERLPE